VRQSSFPCLCITDVFFREKKPETDSDNIAKYMTAVRTEFSTAYPELQILDVHNQTLNLFPPNIFNVNGQVDVVVASPRYTGRTWKSGVLIGIEMITHITDQSFIQAQAECLILSVNSSLPVIQLLTDMENGGVAYYVVTDPIGRRIECRVFISLTSMWEFARTFLASFESDVISGSAYQCRESNASPLLNGNKFRKYHYASGAAAEPSQINDVVLRFLSNFQQDSEANDLDQPVEDFNDEFYSHPPSAVIPDFSYFN